MKKSTMAGIGAAAVLAMAALAAGCGSSSDSASGSSTDTTTTTTPDLDRAARRATRCSRTPTSPIRRSPITPSRGTSSTRRARSSSTTPTRQASPGAELQPEVAEAMPTVSNGDKTYTFTVRDGFKFSPPSGAPVTAMTFKKVIERDLSKAMNSPAQSFAGDILGARSSRPARPRRSVASRSTATRSRSRSSSRPPTSSPASRCRSSARCRRTRRSTPTASSPRPRAGPYYIKSRTPSRQIVLAKNPNYGGDRKTSLDGMIFTVGSTCHRIAARRQERHDRLGRGRPAAGGAPGARA